MNDQMVEAINVKHCGNSLHLLTEATDKMARTSYNIDGSDVNNRSLNDYDLRKQLQPLKSTSVNNNADKDNYINVSYQSRSNIRNQNNKRDICYEEKYDDDERETKTDHDNCSTSIYKTSHREYKKQICHNHSIRQLVPEYDDSHTTSENLISITSHDYNNFVNANEQASSNADLNKQVEVIIKDYVWCQYKLPDDTDYQYSSRFSCLILKRLNCDVKTMNKRAQEMWTRVMPMVRAEYQITRSTVTQAMKTTFFNLFSKNIVLQIFEIEKGRSNSNSSRYKIFCENYLPCVIGKIKFKTNCYAKLLKEYCTVSDEAMSILIYSNNFDQWLHMSKINNKNCGLVKRHLKTKSIESNDCDDNVDPKFISETAYVNSNINETNLGEKPPQKFFLCKKGRGYTYSQQGYIYFNLMCSTINTDRKINGDQFDKEFLKHLNDNVPNGKKKKKDKRTKINKENIVRAYVEGEPGRGTMPLKTKL